MCWPISKYIPHTENPFDIQAVNGLDVDALIREGVSCEIYNKHAPCVNESYAETPRHSEPVLENWQQLVHAIMHHQPPSNVDWEWVPSRISCVVTVYGP
jgi:hypothetical protein